MRELRIIGAGGHGRVVADFAEAAGRWGTIRFLDDRFPDGGRVDDWDVMGGLALLDRAAAGSDHADYLVALGDNRLRETLCRRILADGRRLATLIHPSAVVSRRAEIGAGTVVFANVVVNIGAVVEMGAILNTGCCVEHDCRIGAFSHIAPGALLAGEIEVGERGWVGIGASVRNGIRIGPDATIGAGAAVIRDVEAGATIVGVPGSELHNDPPR